MKRDIQYITTEDLVIPAGTIFSTPQSDHPHFQPGYDAVVPVDASLAYIMMDMVKGLRTGFLIERSDYYTKRYRLKQAVTIPAGVEMLPGPLKSLQLTPHVELDVGHGSAVVSHWRIPIDEGLKAGYLEEIDETPTADGKAELLAAPGEEEK